MKKFRTWHDQIEEVEINRETAKYVILPPYERRDAKRSDIGYNYFDSWQEARQFLIDREKTAIVDLLAKVKQHQETLDKLQEMSQP
jgi:hypothetical protein